MIFNWFRIINEIDFLNSGLVVQELTFDLLGVGEKTFVITKGEVFGVTCDGVFIPIIFEENPMIFEGSALFVDVETRDIYWGFSES